MGEYKWKELGMEYKLADTKEPSKDLMVKVKDILGTSGKLVTFNA
jgi:pyruvate formate lyase activating enzyme